MASPLIQQLLNLLQDINVTAIRFDKAAPDKKPPITPIFLATGATGDGSPSPPPNNINVSDYLVSFTTPDGETAMLTRAQAEVIMEVWHKQVGSKNNGGGTAPLGRCRHVDGSCDNNVKLSDCPSPSQWTQNAPCPETPPDQLDID